MMKLGRLAGKERYRRKAGLLAAIMSTAALYSVSAAAQSSITLFGVVDQGVRYTTHADPQGDSRVQLANGANESLWGFKGAEDIGGGTKVIFQLENRFFPNTGATDPAYPFFNTAFVGLQSSSYGKLTMGRQINPLTDAVVGAFVTNAWLPTFYQFRPEVMMAQGVWTSNMVKYAAHWQYLTAEVSYAFGGNAGAFGSGSQIGASILYLPGAPLRLAAAYLDSRDAVNGSAHFKSWTAGGSYSFGDTTVNAGWAVNRQDAGFVGNFPNGPFTPPELSALKFNTFSAREMFFGGVTQLVGNATHLSANVWRTIQTGKTQAADGNATQFQLLADYNWSKRTDTYLEADYSLYRGGMVGAQFQGINALSSAYGTTQLGIMAGIRHTF
ncbi:Outer membrane porin protein 32 [Paraburkholderia domus]|jgi:Outer membrane protein (porin)|uniref:Outer membrane porin protein 32 n=2 Tax=Paraburkholderia domus TaxID=2793075 RepID=A0A9N8QYP5_9BURK|nr:porin [Paraburkholderia domus]MBK5048504.1 porin [Burkholderia sp. R-70006]MBK5060907.1 porin [Burkholderia sp. R-70199]MBK5085919.1 porin [Burkholderia sp. R-69927]MBK5120497.1 porin [Burkholderia sp. R-69980]MBK5166106.1 porin [Burkholderia sp. R-70211]MBK5180663.1 porin [Burkholderia sp. R-69749]MCI0146270.1 porin [Paraburkholderia sediminicola]